MREAKDEAREVLNRTSRCLAAIRPENIPDRLAAIAHAAADLERIGASFDRLSEMGIAMGLGVDAVQKALVDGKMRMAKVIPLRKKGKRREMKLGKLSDVQPEPVRWLWPDRIARKLVLFTGLPDCGKTTVAIDIAARVTQGREWPDGTGLAPHGSVIFLTSEDGVADTIRTRADAAGADTRKIYFLEAMQDENGGPASFNLQQDLTLLAEHADAIGDVAMIVIDPISSYLGPVDSHRTADVRAILSPLKDFADAHGVAVIGIAHPSKSATSAMNSVSGSGAFVAASRATWLFTREQCEGEETGRTLMLSVKNNLSGLRHNGLGFRIGAANLSEGITAPFVLWDAEPVTITADQAVAAALDPAKPEGGEALGLAMTFLEDEFSVAPRIEASDLVSWAKNFGISEKVLRTAKSKLGVVMKREGFGPGSKCYLSMPGGKP